VVRAGFPYGAAKTRSPSFQGTIDIRPIAASFAEANMGGALIIPLVALLFPILLLITALVFDAVIILWTLYRSWHDRRRGHLGRRVLQL
jgi:hypothetical protein